MKLNLNYARAAGLIMGFMIWAILVVLLLSVLVYTIVTLNVLGIFVTLAVSTVFAYFTAMAVDKLDLL